MLHPLDDQSIPSQPRLTAILCCQSNLMPLSWHMPISRDPFRYAVAVRDENHTHSMLHEFKSFTLNFLPYPYHEQIDRCGRVHGNEMDKLSWSALTSTQTDQYKNILLDESDYAYECRIIDTYQNGDHTIFIADVEKIHLNDSISGTPTLFLGRGRYATLSAIEQIQQGDNPL